MRVPQNDSREPLSCARQGDNFQSRREISNILIIPNLPSLNISQHVCHNDVISLLQSPYRSHYKVSIV